MKENAKFLVCTHCGNVVEQLCDSGAPLSCCGEAMKRLEPGASDGAAEKHVPVCTREGAKVSVRVGEVPHPMLPEHYIGWVWLLTRQGGGRRRLQAGDAASAVFTVAEGDAPLAVYAWCNLHGLWMAEIV